MVVKIIPIILVMKILIVIAIEIVIAVTKLYEHRPRTVCAEIHELNSCKLCFFRIAYCAHDMLLL